MGRGRDSANGVRRRWIRSVAWFLALAAPVVACSGEDQGRPAAPTAPPELDASNGDACAAAGDFEFLSIVDFEGPPAVGMAPVGGPPPSGTALSCNPALAAGRDSGEGGAGGAGGGGGAGGEPDDVPVCGFNFNWDNPTTCNVDPVSTGKPQVNLATSGPWVGLEVPGGRCGTPSHAYHLVATNLGVCFSATTGRRGWGSNFAIDLAGGTNMEGTPFDASAWQGIAFWARIGDGPSNEAINVLVGDSDTSGGDYAEPTESGYTSCVTVDSTYDSVKCDPFGAAVTLTREWVLYTIPFEQLKQKGYGQEAPNGAIDRSKIWRFQISTSTGDWDFYVDDLAFFRKKP